MDALPVSSSEEDAAAGSDLRHIVLNINYGGLAGLGATLVSMIGHCSQPDRLMLHIMCSQLAEEHKGNIAAVLEGAGYTGGYRFIDYDAGEHFGHLPALLGDLTTYGRLLIPDFVEVDKVTYLDSDLVIACDIIELCDIDIGDQLIGGVTRGQVGTALDRHYFLDRGVAATMPYFNAGILLMNLAKWRAEKVEARWKAIVADEPTALRAHDQTTLNFLCQGDFYRLPEEYNTPFLAHHSSEGRQSGILHFIGSPKPWDFMGSLIHQGYPLWKKYNPALWERSYLSMNGDRLRRTWQIRRSIMRSALSRMKG